MSSSEEKGTTPNIDLCAQVLATSSEYFRQLVIRPLELLRASTAKKSQPGEWGKES
jgi:hypothetical protein